MSTENNTPRKYRKQPVVINAMQLPEAYPDGIDPASDDYARNLAAAAVLDWLREELGDAFDPLADEVPRHGWSIDPGTGALLLSTLEGVMRATPGDWIIRGVQGEFYPCKPDIFAATYSLAHRAPCVAGEVCGEASHCPPSDTPQRASDQPTNSPITADKHDVAAALAEHLDGALIEGLGRVLVGADSEDDADLVLETSGPAFNADEHAAHLTTPSALAESERGVADAGFLLTFLIVLGLVMFGTGFVVLVDAVLR
jgi:hypothetical protein